MRDLISAMRSRAISPSRLFRRSFDTNSTVSSMARAARSAMLRSRKRTCRAIGLRRCPWQVSHAWASSSSHSFQAASSPLCSSSKPSRARPVPKQSSHQPCLELNENSRGSSSAKLVPQEGQARLMLNTCTLGFFAVESRSSTCTRPLPRSSALMTLRSSVLFISRALSFCTRICATGNSMVCSLNRFRRGHW